MPQKPGDVTVWSPTGPDERSIMLSGDMLRTGLNLKSVLLTVGEFRGNAPAKLKAT